MLWHAEEKNSSISCTYSPRNDSFLVQLASANYQVGFSPQCSKLQYQEDVLPGVSYQEQFTNIQPLTETKIKHI